MSYLDDRVLDFGLTILDTEVNRLDICSQEPTNYTEATSTYSLGNSTLVSIGSPLNKVPSGRRVVVASLPSGLVTSSGTANYWALVDTVNSRLLAAGLLDSPAAVTSGDGFSLDEFEIGVPDPYNFYLRPDGNSLYLRPDGTSQYARPLETSDPIILATAMRVRESAGNSEEDIPLAANGFVDETALTTHVGANSGFVVRWHDVSGNDNDAIQATVNSQPRIVNAGTVDEGLVFDGSNDFMTPTSLLSFPGEFTVAFWAKRLSTASWDVVLGFSSGTSHLIGFPNNTNEIAVRIGSNIQRVNHLISSTQWNHFAVTRNSDNKVDLYVNGVHRSRMFSDTAQSGTVSYDRIGVDLYNYFQGYLEQLYCANSSLSQIADLMNGTLPTSGTVLYLKAKDVSP